MPERRDPVTRLADDSVDLYDISTWEERTWLDRASNGVYDLLVTAVRAVVVLLAVLILAAQFALTGLAAVTEPVVGAFTLLSVVPALGLAAYIWYADVTMSEPLTALVVTFLLGVLFAEFALVFNTLFGVLFAGFAAAFNVVTRLALSGVPVRLIGMTLFFYLVVGPVEETVKWLAVRLYAFRREEFDAVIDGAVYGAMAGLGFATIENAIYITGALETAQLSGTAIRTAGQTATARLFAGPGHVIYSAFAGYYLGLAKFNRENAGPIVVKGLLIAAFIHATYNTLVSVVPEMVTAAYPSVSASVAFIGFVLVYDGLFGFLLYRKIARYRRAYREANERETVAFVDESDAPPTVDDDPIDADSEDTDATNRE